MTPNTEVAPGQTQNSAAPASTTAVVDTSDIPSAFETFPINIVLEGHALPPYQGRTPTVLCGLHMPHRDEKGLSKP